MKGQQQQSSKKQQKQRKQNLEQELKQIIDQIKETYFEFLSSLKFQNISDKQSYKDMLKSYRPVSTFNPSNQQNIYDVDNPHRSFSQFDMGDNGPAKQSISELLLKTFSFEEELAVENKGYTAFIRLINNIKQLQDYNHFLRSIVMNADHEGYLEKFENQLLEDLKKLENQIPNQYFLKKN